MYFLYFKYKIHVLYFVTFSGTSILYFVLIHLFEGYFVFCIKIHFDVFLPISDCRLSSNVFKKLPEQHFQFPCFLSLAGHQFRAHKAVLAACSQFFHTFFQDFTQEPLVEIEGIVFYFNSEKSIERRKADVNRPISMEELKRITVVISLCILFLSISSAASYSWKIFVCAPWWTHYEVVRHF